jgi:predicted SAM-dependent methyltransferase
MNFVLNQNYRLKFEDAIVDAIYKGKVLSMCLSNVTKSLDECHLIEINKQVSRIAETDLQQAYQDYHGYKLDDIPS